MRSYNPRGPEISNVNSFDYEVVTYIAKSGIERNRFLIRIFKVLQL